MIPTSYINVIITNHVQLGKTWIALYPLAEIVVARLLANELHKGQFTPMQFVSPTIAGVLDRIIIASRARLSFF